MPVFQYTARTLKGALVNDKIDLPTRDDVIAHLRKNRMVVVQVRAAPKEFKLNLKFGGGVKTRDVVVFTRQFATMINARTCTTTMRFLRRCAMTSSRVGRSILSLTSAP